jgi:hypothetical protein
LIDQAVKAIRATRLHFDGLGVDKVALHPCDCGCWTVFESTRTWNGGYSRRRAIEVEHFQQAQAIYKDVLPDLNVDTFVVNITEVQCRECHERI